MPRRRMIEQLADAVAAIRRPHPVRVGIDGAGAAGKTTLADELAAALRDRGRQVIRAGVDGFHNPPEVRYRRGRECVHGYYHDSFNYAAMRQELLEPLGPSGDRRYRRAVYDFRVESAVDEPHETAVGDAVLLFEGVFVMRPELIDHWDYTVFVHADFDVALQRAEVRERAHFGDAETVRRKYEGRYIPGQRMYFEQCEPHRQADAVVDNNAPDRPSVRFNR